MTRILPNLNLTYTQSEVLVKIHQASTPHLAKAETESSQKAIVASGVLKDIGAIDITTDTASVTPAGEDIMNDEGLLDDAGQLTTQAQLFIGGEQSDAPEEPESDFIDLELKNEGKNWTLIHEMNNITNFNS